MFQVVVVVCAGATVVFVMVVIPFVSRLKIPSISCLSMSIYMMSSLGRCADRLRAADQPPRTRFFLSTTPFLRSHAVSTVSERTSTHRESASQHGRMFCWNPAGFVMPYCLGLFLNTYFVLLQLGVLYLGLLEDRDVRVSVFPERKEFLIGRLRLSFISRQSVSPGQLQMRQCADGFVQQEGQVLEEILWPLNPQGSVCALLVYLP